MRTNEWWIWIAVLLAPACTGSHDRHDGGDVDAGGPAMSDADGGPAPGTGTDAGSGPDPATGPADAGAFDLLAACDAVCSRIAECAADVDRLGCIEGCLDLRDSIGEPGCEDALSEALDCVIAQPCSAIGSESALEHGPCAGPIAAVDDACASATASGGSSP